MSALRRRITLRNKKNKGENQGYVTEVTVVLGHNPQSRRIRRRLHNVSIQYGVQPTRIVQKLLKYSIAHTGELNIAVKNRAAYFQRSKIKRGQVYTARIDVHSKKRLEARAERVQRPKIEVYNNILDAALRKAEDDAEWIESIITSVDPVDPWPNGIKKELK